MHDWKAGDRRLEYRCASCGAAFTVELEEGVTALESGAYGKSFQMMQELDRDRPCNESKSEWL